jgi:hypothetical protein
MATQKFITIYEQLKQRIHEGEYTQSHVTLRTALIIHVLKVAVVRMCIHPHVFVV